MAIFGFLELEDVVQVNDKTRLSAVKSFVSKDSAAITKVEISPDEDVDAIEVTGTSPDDWFLDWQYEDDGDKVVTVFITVAGVEEEEPPEPVEFTKTLTVVSAADDLLWSTDADLISYEPDILKWVPAGRNSFLNIHRGAQKLILEWLDATRIWKSDGTRLEKEDMLVSQDLKQLSIFWTLSLIFLGISNKPDDVFAKKAEDYQSKVASTKNRGRIQADFNDNTVLDSGEGNDQRSFRMVRR